MSRPPKRPAPSKPDESPGCFVIARTPVRDMLARRPSGVDGDDVAFYVLLALEADDELFSVRSLGALAAHYGIPERRLRGRLRRLAKAHWISWIPAQNAAKPGWIILNVRLEHRSALDLATGEGLGRVRVSHRSAPDGSAGARAVATGPLPTDPRGARARTSSRSSPGSGADERRAGGRGIEDRLHVPEDLVGP